MSLARKIKCVVDRIDSHGGGVYTLDLRPCSPLPTFRPGQFLHLTVDDYDPSSFWPESRVFSIASSPRQRQLLRICYSVKGRYTQKMESLLKVGGEVWAKMPYGEFFIEGNSDAVLVAGGTGISAFTAFIEALSPETPTRVWLAYGARHPGLFLFQDLILKQCAALPHFRTLFFAETGAEAFSKDLVAISPVSQCIEGRISIPGIFSKVPDAGKKVYYLSGPPVMLSTLGDQLKAHGLAPEQIRTDAWE